MTEQQIRDNLISIARSYMGTKQRSLNHKELISIYNDQKVLPRGHKMLVSESWCAMFVTACSIKAGTQSVMIPECSCNEMITGARKLGIWVEDDGYIPKIGDFCLYDWDDTGKGDCTGQADHIGIVESVGSTSFRVIEGNMGSSHVVGERSMMINGRYIRGFITPKYASLVRTTWTTPTVYLPFLKQGDVSPYVGILQTLLNARGFNCGEVDNSFGPKTFAAVKKIRSTGTVNAEVWAALLKKELF